MERAMTRPSLAFESAGDLVWDAIVLGAGPAGAIVARQLAVGGARILLVDRKSFPRGKVCGACLNMSALGVLESVGLNGLAADLGGITLETLELAFSGRGKRLALPGGVALSRARLDAALVDAAVSSGAAFLGETQGLVAGVGLEARRVLLVRHDRTITAAARVVLIATGLGQPRFEGGPAVETLVAPRSRVGAWCTIAEHPDFYRERAVFMAVGRGGYVGLVRVEGGYLNVAAAFEKELLRRCGSPGMAATMMLAEAGFPAPPALRGVPWQGTIPLTRRTRPIAGERFFLLGDATGYVEPFTGEGMAWALISGKAIVPLVLRGIDRWDPSLPRAWASLHRRLIARKQDLCRGLAILLRHPWLARTVFELAALAPGMAGLVVRRVNAPSVLSESS
jgi:menaquinone-9 beta-reductase